MSKKPPQITTLHMTILNVEVAFDWDISSGLSRYSASESYRTRFENA